MLLLAAAFILSYLLGSLVAGVVYSRLRGDDIRTRDLPGGSGTYRQYGRGAAVLVSLVDILKGALAVMLAEQIAPGSGWLATSGVVLGHCYPVWFGLRGGGGIAPFLGALLVVAPWTMLATLALALAVIPVYRATAQARLRLNAIPFAAALALPLGALIATRLGGLGEFLAGSAAMALRAGHLLAEGRGKA
ncbi:acyl-phosphate glycerol 3-phosphate acyltransferase [Deinococcus reticulitermitis]|uniref:Acyl-phosphate glycerol 3-phosphate acyltransferase n=1 Tax=Deinococcus reticulitermitis TaxID=856736 RepID=A0A1H7BLR9_9DEIO|nr:glycerol-3-phosphate acyltransferase [Deinococcus reticulitermitis]SEJ75180.1 acyl-phosphate glycerol 3-phosphate acyltransferase [Deinococcus reticulitermitis]